MFILWFLNTDKLVKKTRLRLVFSTCLSVFRNQRKQQVNCNRMWRKVEATSTFHNIWTKLATWKCIGRQVAQRSNITKHYSSLLTKKEEQYIIRVINLFTCLVDNTIVLISHPLQSREYLVLLGLRGESFCRPFRTWIQARTFWFSSGGIEGGIEG